MDTPVVEYIKNTDAQNAVIGREIPAEFVEMLAASTQEALSTWLKANQVPELITDAIDDLVMLERAAKDLRSNHLSDWDASWLSERVARVTRTIADLGGKFEGGGSVWPARDPIKWIPQTEEVK